MQNIINPFPSPQSCPYICSEEGRFIINIVIRAIFFCFALNDIKPFFRAQRADEHLIYEHIYKHTHTHPTKNETLRRDIKAKKNCKTI